MATYTEIAAQLIEIFQRIMPPPSRQKASRSAGKAADVSGAMERFYDEARVLRERHRLGIYGRARVAFELQGRMLKEGYPADLCRQVLISLVLSAFVGRG